MSECDSTTNLEAGASSLKLADKTAKTDAVQHVFSMFKSYLVEQFDQKGKEFELKSKMEKDIVQLKYKGNQKQLEVNAQIDLIFHSIQTEFKNLDTTKLIEQGKELIHKRQKLIKIADRNKDGWQVVEE